MTFSFDSGNIFSSCFFYLAAGMIAGTVAHFIVRGRLGCLLGNFFLGLAGAIVASFIINLFFPLISSLLPKNVAQNASSVGFMGTVIIASIMATLISLLFNWAIKAEKRHQQDLLDRSHMQSPPTT